MDCKNYADMNEVADNTEKKITEKELYSMYLSSFREFHKNETLMPHEYGFDVLLGKYNYEGNFLYDIKDPNCASNVKEILTLVQQKIDRFRG